jgi:hypothetical protein
MIPKNAKKIALRPLAMGEKTGHHHSLVSLVDRDVADLAEMYTLEEDSKVRTFLRVLEDECVALVHQEHKAHLVPAGEYEVVVQTEVTEWGSAAVLD